MFSQFNKLFLNLTYFCLPLFIFFPCYVMATNSSLLHIYNWSDYIAPDTIANFEQKTAIKVTYDVFDSNELLDGKLMTGNTGFDLVVPSDNFLARQIKVGLYLPLDKSKLPNYKNLDPILLQMMALHDPQNTYSIPYMWQSTGIGYNIKKVQSILGDDAPLDSWDLVFNIENLKKLNECGVAFLDTPSEMYPTVLNYLGKDPNSHNPKDYEQATHFLETLRPYVTYFHNSKYITDLSGGDICVAIGWSGDMMQAYDAAIKAKQGVNIGYSIPKEGAMISFDVWAIPKDAKHINSAYQFLNYLLEPQVIANVTNYIFYPSANKEAIAFVNPNIRNNPNIYPSDEVLKRLFIVTEQSPKIDRVMVRLWTKVLSGH